MKRYTLKGINDDATECSVCGKVELKRVMWLQEIDEDGCEVGEPFHCGTTCGAKLMGRKISTVNTAVKNFDSKVALEREYLHRSHRSYVLANKVMQELNRTEEGFQIKNHRRMSFAERTSHPLYLEYKRLDSEAREWANAQQVAIEI